MTTKIKSTNIEAGAITSDALGTSIVTGLTEVTTLDYTNDFTLVYDASDSSLKKIQAGNFAPPLDLSAVDQHIIPDGNSVYDLGEPENKFRDLYLSSATIHMGDTKMSVDTTTGDMVIKGADDLPRGIKAKSVELDDVSADATFKTVMKKDNGRIKFVKVNRSTGVEAAVEATDLSSNDTDDVAEGSTNLYYTDDRVRNVLTTDSIANESYVDTAISNLIGGAPAALDTLNELAAAIGDDASYAASVTTSLGTKAAKATTISAGTGLTGGGDLSANRTLALAASGVTAGTYGSSTAIPVLVVDTYGRITSVSNTNITVGDGTLTVASGSGLSGSGTFTANQTTNGTITLSHADTSSASSVNNSGSTVIQDITLDGFGHITGIGSTDLSSQFLGITAKAADSDLLDGLNAKDFFNNMGQGHSAYTDFNSFGDFGARFMQGGTNGPTGSGQWYGFTLGLGSQYNSSSYNSQLYWGRQSQTNQNQYIWIRDREAGTWGSWRKAGAGNADTLGSSSLNSTQFLRSDTSNAGGASLGNLTVGDGNSDSTIWRPSYTGLHFSSGIYPSDGSGAVSDAAVDLGHASHRFQDGFFSGAITASSFSGNGSSLTNVNATTVDGHDSNNLQKQATGTSTTLSADGWYTIANVSGSRSKGIIHLSDVQSSRHNFVTLYVMWSYGHGSITVLNGGRHGHNTIVHARLLYNSANQTYGGAKLQIYCENTGLAWGLQVNQDYIENVPGWGNISTISPVLENSPTDYAEYKTVNYICGPSSNAGDQTGLATTGSVRIYGRNLKLPTSTADPTYGIESGSTYFNTTDKALKIYDGSNWGSVVFSPLGSQENPATSAQAILADDPSATDGVYYIQSTSGVVATYCMMSWGGYMLAMKINNSFDNNFRYDGSYFTTTSPVNESSCANTSAADAVSRLYYEYNITAGVRFSMGSVGNYLNESAGGSVVNRTLKQCMTGSATNSDRSRSEFLSWQQNATGASPSNWDNQPNCNTAGFNISLNGSEHQCRWGLQMNNEGDCSSNDAAVGIGCHTNNFYSGRTGNCSAHRWNPDQIWHQNGWVWVK